MSQNNHRLKYEQKLDKINYQLAKRKKCHRGQETIFTRQAVQEIGEELDFLKKSFPIKHTLVKKERMLQQDDSMTVRSIRRIVKLRFRCTNQKCSEFHQKEKKSPFSETQQWTSYYGLVDLRFYFERVPNRNTTNIFYSFFIYRQKCKNCLEWGKCGLIESCFDLLLSLYRLLLKECLTKIKEKK